MVVLNSVIFKARNLDLKEPYWPIIAVFDSKMVS